MPASKEKPVFDFESVSVKVAEQVREVIREAIMSGRLKPGDKLPSEDSLAEQFHVSKTAVREALGQLVAEGLIEKRRGATGGSFVAEGDSARILEVVVDCYRLGGLTLAEVIQFRRKIEPVVVELACRQREEDDLKAMAENLSLCRHTLDQGQVERAAQVDFHRLVAEASHNRLIAASMTAALKISREFTSKLNFSYEDGQLDFDYNRRLYECITEGRSDEARSIMLEHFEQSRVLVERYHHRHNNWGKRARGED